MMEPAEDWYRCDAVDEDFFNSLLALELASRAWDRGPVEVKTPRLQLRPLVDRSALRFYRPRSGWRAEISNIFG